MTTLLPPPLSLSAPIPGVEKKKRVLLVDTSQAKRELRAEVMRKLGMDVDCAADIAEARSWWRAAFYDLVLINMEKGQAIATDFVRRFAMPLPRSGWRSWSASQNILRIHPTRMKSRRCRMVTSRSWAT